jgi:hypothetical protein
MCRQVLLNIPNIRFHKTLPGGSRDSPCGQTKTDSLTKSTVPLRTAFANAPKIAKRRIFLKPEINGIMLFPIIYWLRDAQKLVRWNQDQCHSVYGSNTLHLHTLLFMFYKRENSGSWMLLNTFYYTKFQLKHISPSFQNYLIDLKLIVKDRHTHTNKL